MEHDPRGHAFETCRFPIDAATFRGLLAGLPQIVVEEQKHGLLSRLLIGAPNLFGLGVNLRVGVADVQPVGDGIEVTFYTAPEDDRTPGFGENPHTLLRKVVDAVKVKAQAATPTAPAEIRRSGRRGLTRSEKVERLVMILKAEEIQRDDPKMTHAELVRKIGWTAGSSRDSRIRLFGMWLNDKLADYRESDPQNILQDAQQELLKEKKKI
jgi:hypothetical protein